MAADWLAKVGKGLSSSTTCESSPSSDLIAIIGADVMGHALMGRGV